MPHPRGEIERRAAERERERSRFIQTLSHSVRLAKTRLSILARPCVHRSPPLSFLLLLPRFYLFRFLPPVSGSILPPFFCSRSTLIPPHQRANALFAARSRLLEDVSVAGSTERRGHVATWNWNPSGRAMTRRLTAPFRGFEVFSRIEILFRVLGDSFDSFSIVN